jgi:hypothetical protein
MNDFQLAYLTIFVKKKTSPNFVTRQYIQQEIFSQISWI